MSSFALRAAACAALLSVAVPARADEVVFRGNYWRDRNTRVIQPEAMLSKELSTGTVMSAHYLLDAITSASAASGAGADQAFTELRNEVGFGIGQRAGLALMSAAYSYSQESDYTAHTLTLSTVVDLFKKNTTLGFVMSWGANSVDQRAGATVFIHVGGLQTLSGIFTLTQVLSETLLLNLSYDIGIIGFGDAIGSITGSANADTGYQGNPYRSILIGGSPSREVVPFQRIRQSVAAALNWYIPTGGRIVPYLALRPSYRFYWDDWGLQSHTPELRLFLPIGPTELRLTGRYYTQSAAVFANEVDARPQYPDGHGLPCTTCVASQIDDKTGQPRLYAAADPKLYAFDSMLLEVRLLIKLSGLSRLKKLPLHDWLGGGLLELSYGHYFESGVAHAAFGDADLAGISLAFPL